MRLLIFLLISFSGFAQESNLSLPNVYETTVPGMEIHCSETYFSWNDPLTGFFQLVNTETQAHSPIFSLPKDYKPFSLQEMYNGNIIFGMDTTRSIYAKVNGKVGAIDVYGNEVRPFKFDHAARTGNLRLLKKGKKWFLDTLAFTKLIPVGKGDIVGYGGHWDDYVLIKNGNKSIFVEATGKVGTPRTFYDEFEKIERDVFMINLNDSAGLVNSMGEFVLELDDIRLAGGHGFWVSTKDNKQAMINADGKLVTEYKYKHIAASNYGEFTVYYIGNKQGIIDLEGNEMTPAEYDYLMPLINGFVSAYYVKDGSRMHGCLNGKGEIVIPFEYDNEIRFLEGLAFVEKDGKCGFINEQNEIVIDFILDWDRNSHFDESGTAKVKLNGEFVTINRKGEIVEDK